MFHQNDFLFWASYVCGYWRMCNKIMPAPRNKFSIIPFDVKADQYMLDMTGNLDADL